MRPACGRSLPQPPLVLGRLPVVRSHAALVQMRCVQSYERIRTLTADRRCRRRKAPGDRQALPRMRFILVPQTGQVPCAMRRPESLTRTSPSKVRFSLHFTQ